MLYAAFGFGMSLMGAAAGTFNLLFIREEVGLGDGAIVQISAIAQAVSMVALWYGRRRLDERGSKRYIYLGLIWLVAYFCVWFAMAGRIVPGMLVVAPILMIFNGFVGGLLDLAGTRMLMNICGDRHGSSQYFAVQQTGANLATGFSPLLWGIALDAMRGGEINRYFVFFGAEIVLVVMMALLLTRVRER